MVDDFSEHPKSVAEIRSDRSQSASDWSARDALISVLRRIDAGEINAEAVVITVRTRVEGGDGVGFWWSCASPDIHVTLGLLARAAFVINDTAEPG